MACCLMFCFLAVAYTFYLVCGSGLSIIKSNFLSTIKAEKWISENIKDDFQAIFFQMKNKRV